MIYHGPQTYSDKERWVAGLEKFEMPQYIQHNKLNPMIYSKKFNYFYLHFVRVNGRCLYEVFNFLLTQTNSKYINAKFYEM